MKNGMSGQQDNGSLSSFDKAKYDLEQYRTRKIKLGVLCEVRDILNGAMEEINQLIDKNSEEQKEGEG